MIRHPRSRAATCGAVLTALFVASAAHAQTRDAAGTKAPPIPAFDPTVHEVFSRDLSNQCEYRAEVRGTVRPTSLRGSSADGSFEDESPRYAANLRVQPELHCAGVAAVRGPVGTVRGPGLTGDEIAHSLGARATLRTGRGARACVYEPVFEARDGRPAGRDVRYRCEAGAVSGARGGGEAAQEQQGATVSVFDDE